MRKGREIRLCRALLVIACCAFLTACSQAETKLDTRSQVEEAAERIIEWKKNGEEAVITKEYLEGAATSSNDWFVFAMARLQKAEDYESYYEAMENQVTLRYEQEDKLDKSKATEWHRISLTMLAMGKDPTNVNGIDLVADGTYDRGKTMELDAQGINGYIWALLVLDAGSYEVPEGAYETREGIKQQILGSQAENGSWGLMKGQESVDLTAMALTALAPYKEEKEAGEAIEQGLSYLSTRQNEEGGFLEQGKESSETISQVLVALSSLGIDQEKEERFCKKGTTVLQRLLNYQQKDGGFAHALEEETSNAMASEQACYALAAYLRYLDGEGRLYEFGRR